MICKVHFVPTVKEIMPQQSLANAWRWHVFAIFGANGTYKSLDRSPNMYIITFTYRTRRSGDLVNAQQGSQKVQARCPQAARHAESTSERGDRSPVPNWRFLRSRRHRASQVRDASPRHSRQAV